MPTPDRRGKTSRTPRTPRSRETVRVPRNKARSAIGNKARSAIGNAPRSAIGDTPRSAIGDTPRSAARPPSHRAPTAPAGTAAGSVPAEPVAPAEPSHPKRLTGAERREHILDTSMRVFAARGFSATKTKDLALAAGVSEALIFKLFPDKEHLYRALIERKIRQAEAMLPLQDLATSDDPPDRFFARIADVILERVEQDPSFLRLILFSALEGHPLATEFDAARVRGFRAAIATYVRRKQRTGALRRGDADFAARTFLGLVGAFVQARTICRETEIRAVPRKRLVRSLVDAFLRGIEA